MANGKWISHLPFAILLLTLSMSRTVSIPQAIELALRHHRAGEFPQAESIYRQVLASDPRNLDALQLLGTLAHQVGRNDVAIELLMQAIALKGDVPHYHNNLGKALLGMNRL